MLTTDDAAHPPAGDLRPPGESLRVAPGRSLLRHAFLPLAHEGSPWAGYILAVALAVASMLFSVVVDRSTDTTILTVPLAAVVMSAWWGGLRPGLLVVALWALGAPLLLPDVRDTSHVIGLVVFVIVGVGMSFLVARAQQGEFHRRELLGDVLDGLAGQQAAQEVAREAERRWHVLVESMPALVSTTDATGTVTFHNQRWLDFSGRTREELRDHWSDVVHPDDLPQLVAGWQRALADSESVDAEFRARRHDGVYCWHHSITMPVADSAGAPSMWVNACIDIDQRRHAEDALMEREAMLTETADRLAQANAAKDDFLGMVSHELRTPITTIAGNADVLVRRAAALDDAARLSAMQDIHTEAERLSRIVDNLLVLARLDSGQRIDAEPVPLRRVTERIAGVHMRRYPHRQIRVAAHDLALVNGVDGYIEQILGNFISNAEKYSPADAPIDITIDAEAPGVVTVRVADRGPGVRDDEYDAVFTSFFRSAATSHGATGIGIGLAVCKRLGEAQGGRVWVEPRRGGGAVFALSLPASDEGGVE